MTSFVASKYICFDNSSVCVLGKTSHGTTWNFTLDFTVLGFYCANEVAKMK